MNPETLRVEIIRPVLIYTKMHSQAAENLLVGTAGAESDYGEHFVQIKGPAKGIYQMEPATHSSIWDDYLAYFPELASMARGIASQHLFSSSAQNTHQELVYNIAYATVMARIRYKWIPAKLPEANDIIGLARYWKTHYNTHQGAGKVKDFVNKYSSEGS